MTAPLILVDERNAPVGVASWKEAHGLTAGKLHRAFSVYVFRKNGTELLIQKRSAGKLFAGLWANSCCSHPREGEEDVVAVAERRLRAELGFTCPLHIHSTFVYQAEDPHGKGAEHEHVTIFRGDLEGDVIVKPNPEEVAEWKWVNVVELMTDMDENVDLYAPWFHIGMRKVGCAFESELPDAD